MFTLSGMVQRPVPSPERRAELWHSGGRSAAAARAAPLPCVGCPTTGHPDAAAVRRLTYPAGTKNPAQVRMWAVLGSSFAPESRARLQGGTGTEWWGPL